jgi:LPPG:FO 2-phospho-L-lactate transferase
LIGGKALKGPADVVLADLGLEAGTGGVLSAYRGLIDTLVVDVSDRAEAGVIDGVDVVALDTRIVEPGPAVALARAILDL